MQPGPAVPLTEWYRQYYRYLQTVAYRMTGSLADAEDVVQDVFVRLSDLDVSTIRDAKSYLTRMVVNRSLDFLKSARRKREQYVGPWLPEPEVHAAPLVPPAIAGPDEQLLMEENVSYALLVMLEKLTPAERAVFLLYEVFGYGYGEVADALGKTEPACRKMISRIRKKLKGEDPVLQPKMEMEPELTLKFLQAASTGEIESLMEWLREDVVCVSDGGGKAIAALYPIAGAERVARFWSGLAHKYAGSWELFPIYVNGEPGFGVMEQGRWTTIIALHWRDRRIRSIYMIRNPDKISRAPLPEGI
jgi:RNA polymerase sigma-70 factor (ECF subfamily)